MPKVVKEIKIISEADEGGKGKKFKKKLHLRNQKLIRIDLNKKNPFPFLQKTIMDGFQVVKVSWICLMKKIRTIFEF